MANIGSNFNPQEHEKMRDFGVLPPGQYIAHIVKSEMKPTKTGNGQYLELEFDIDIKEFQGKKVWTRLNLVNSNPDTMKFAQNELKTISDAAGITTTFNDSVVLHGKPMILIITVKPPKDGYAESNAITNYKSVGSNSAFKQATVPGMEQQIIPGMASPEMPLSNETKEPVVPQPQEQNQDKPSWA